MRAAVRLSLLLMLPGGVASAVAPPEGHPSGREPIRVRTVAPAVQRLLDQRPAWQRFLAGEGDGWDARWDEVTGTPHRMWGRGIPLGPLPDGDAVRRAVFAFIARHPDLLGLGGAVPALRSVTRVDALDAWYVDVDTLHDGLPLWRGGLTFRIRHERLVMVGAETYPDAPVVGREVLTADEAVAAFEATGPAPFSPHTHQAASRILLPEVHGKQAVLRRVWAVRSRTEQPLGRWEGFVDAETGEVVAFFNTVRFVDALVETVHDDRLGNGELTVSPLAHATVTDGFERLVTNAFGEVSVDDPTAWRVQFQGPRLRVLDAAGTVEPALTSAVTTLDGPALDGRLAASSAWTFVQEAQDFARAFAPEVSWVDERATVHVNIDESCNAWFDGDLNFLREGDGCRNTGRLADVVFHEWAHGFHYYSLVAGVFDGSLGEGAADTLAFLMTDDSRIAPSFFLKGDRPLRNAHNQQRWPDDFAPGEAYVHTNGMIFSGAMWDTREALRDDLGEPAATEITAAVYAGLLKGGPGLTTAYDEAVFADDDDADLSNGTPNQCALVEGFGLHGLGPLGGFGIRPELVSPLEPKPGVDLPVILEVPNPAKACVDVTPTSGTLVWRVGNDAWERTPLQVDGSEVQATIPGARLALGDRVELYTEILTSTGGTVFEPTGGPIRPRSLIVGDVLEIRCDDFEEDDGHYRHRLLDGEDVEGADDWRWGTPLGLGSDPSEAASGSKVWGNDLGGAEYNGNYQPAKHNQLRSPAIDTRHYEGVFLRYQRWLSVEDGIYDRALVTADGVEVWSNWASDEASGNEHHLDDTWSPHVVDLAGQGDDGEVRVSWEIVSDQGLEYGGWTLDDVCFLAPATADNRLGITDAAATRTDGEVRITWTMPRHAPVEVVRVVRQEGRWPTGHDDGEVVFETRDVALEATAAAVDATRKADLYYAVYASDGETWLSWTREGVNAVAVDPADAGDEPGRCAGCSGTGARGAGGLGALLLGLVAVRRRS